VENELSQKRCSVFV